MQYFNKRFFIKKIIDFHSPFKIVCHPSKLYNFVNITGPYTPDILYMARQYL